MSSSAIHLIGLIVWITVMWDQSLLVETASDQEDDKASRVSRYRLPADIVIPLPYVYPEYVDPRDQTTTAASTTEYNRAQQTTSVGDIILENVRQTMMVLMPIKEFGPTIVNKNKVIKSTDQEQNRHATSTMKILMSNNNDNESIVEQVRNTKPVAEVMHSSGRRSNRFGNRLKTSTQSMKQNFINTTTTTTATMTNDCNDTTLDASLDNNLPTFLQPSPPKSLSGNVIVNGTRNGDNVTLRRRPASRMRLVTVRRVRPNTMTNVRTTQRSVRRLRVKNSQSDAEMERKKSEN